MLLLQDARGQRVFVVIRQHRDGALHDDWPVVEVLVDEMDAAAADLHSVVKGLLLSFQSGKCGQQRRVDIENALRKLLNEPGRQQPHVAR